MTIYRRPQVKFATVFWNMLNTCVSLHAARHGESNDDPTTVDKQLIHMVSALRLRA